MVSALGAFHQEPSAANRERLCRAGRLCAALLRRERAGLQGT
jgi:hypothetical protein